MNEELNLVRDLAVILVSAGLFTIISRALKQPLILGYILAGFLIGPNVKFFFNISSAEAVGQWSEIGLIFMMFGLGLEFSFKKLLKAGSSALVTAGCKFVGVFVLGFVVGQAMSWTLMESLFLAGLLSMSSTAVVIKSYDDMGLKGKPHAGMVFGTLVVEDLIAILLMVLLSTMAVSNQFAGKELMFALAKLVFCIVLWFLVGIFLIPTILKKAKPFINDEILLLVSIGLCFAMVTLASSVGFSSALGAFMMGSILAETIESEHIEQLVKPLKDLFGAIFFVSVGMMIAPDVILDNWLIILILTLLVIVTHIFFSAAGILMSGGGFENAVHTGFSLAQLGEFGFIIAGVGVSLGVMRGFIYPVIIAVSVITTFGTPYMIKLAGPAHAWLLRKLPASWLERLSSSERDNSRTSAAEKNEWKKFLTSYFVRIFLYGILVLAVILGSKYYLEPAIHKLLPSLKPSLQNLAVLSITLAVIAPFLYGLAVNTRGMNKYAKSLWTEKKSNAYTIFGLILIRIFISVGIVIALISTYFSLSWWTVLLLIVSGLVFFLVARSSVRMRNMGLESIFFANLNEKEEQARRRAPVTASIKAKMEGYDVHIESLLVSADSSLVGQKMKDIPFRAQTGTNIVKISRGSSSIIIPGGEETIYPGDRLLAVGTSDQIERLREMVDASIKSTGDGGPDDSGFDVVAITITKESRLFGRTLKSVNMREYRCMVISVLRDGNMITNPRPELEFQEGDTVWIAGELTSANFLARNV